MLDKNVLIAGDWMKEFPPFRLDIADHTLWRGEQRVPLTPKAFAVLQYLVERAGRLVTQNELLEALWPDTFVNPEVLKSQILDVRTALGDRPKDPLFIETVPRRGYRFIAAVNEQRPPVVEARRSTVVGRDDALSALRAYLQKASNGERQIVFITGEQGMGKTTLMEEFLEEVRVPVARGQCLEGFGAVKEPYSAVLEALGQLARSAGRESLLGVLETHAPTWLIQLPSLMKKEHRETLERELLGATRERMIREMCEALEKLTESQLLILFFEDLHWSDHSTVDLISSIAYRRVPARLLLIGTYRPVDIVVSQHPLKPMSHGLKAHRLSKEIALSPLAESEVAEYLTREAEGGTAVEQLAHWIRKQTEGNPLFMVNIIEHLLELGHISLRNRVWSLAKPLHQIDVTVPETLRQMIEMQIERLSPREGLTLDAACVQGVTFSAAAAAAALEIDADGVDDTCQKLARQHFMLRTADVEELPDGTVSQRYEFVHAAFRSVLYQRISAVRRAKLHRRLGEVLETFCAGDRSVVAFELAGHFQQCGDWARAVEYLWMAARNAWHRFEYREAITILEQALQCAGKLAAGERVRSEMGILQNLAVFYHALHDAPRVTATMETLAERAAAFNLPDAEARALLGLATMRGNQDGRASMRLLDRVESLIPKQKDAFTQAEVLAHCSTLRVMVWGWNAQLSEQHAAALAKLRGGGERFGLASTLMEHAYQQWIQSRYADAVKCAKESLPVLLEGGRLFRYLHGRDLVATNLGFLGEWGKALEILDEDIQSAYKNEAPSRSAMPLLFKAWIHLNAMDFSGVLEMCSAAMPNIGPYMLDRKYIAERLIASAELGLGRYESALRGLLATRKEIDRNPVMLSWYWRLPLHLDLVEVYLAQEDLASARREADLYVVLASGTASRTWQALAWDASARVSLAEGETDRAREHSLQALEAVTGCSVPLAAWRVHRTSAITQPEAADYHLNCSRTVVQTLAKSLETHPELQKTFLSAPAVSEVLAHCRAAAI